MASFIVWIRCLRTRAMVHQRMLSWRCVPPTVDHTQQRWTRIGHGCEQWLCAHATGQSEVWCRDRLRVSGSTVCGSVRGGGGDGRRAGDGGYGCGVGVGQGKEWTKDWYGPHIFWIKDSVAVTNLLAVAAGNLLAARKQRNLR